MEFQNLLMEREGEIAVLRLNRPDIRNPMTPEMGDEWIQVVENLKKDPSVKGLVITGKGSAFSAGGDLKMMMQRTEMPPYLNKESTRQFYQNFLSVRSLRIPTIAAVNGPAIGAGACLALGCDIRIAAEQAKFGFTFISVGMHPGMGATYLLPRIVGTAQAYQLLATGEIIDAAEALRLRIVNKVVKAEELMPAAMTLARRIASQSMVAVKMVKESIYINAEEPSLATALDREAALQALTFTTRDIKEGIVATMEKRKAVFRDDI